MRRLRRAIASLITGLTLFALGCGSPSHVPPRLPYPFPGPAAIDVNVYVAPDFTDVEKSTIVNGMLMWERATRGLLSWHMYPYTGKRPNAHEAPNATYVLDVVFHRAHSTDEWVKEWDEANKHTLYGMYSDDEIWLVEDRLRSVDTKTIVAAHEFGHALGLQHVDDKSSVMSRFYKTSTRCLTQHDLWVFCDRYTCLLPQMTTQCSP